MSPEVKAFYDLLLEVKNIVEEGDSQLLEKVQTVIDEMNNIQWQTEADKLTADEYATAELNTMVKKYVSNGDGTFTEEDTNEFSALHWARLSKIGSGEVAEGYAAQAKVSQEQAEIFAQEALESKIATEADRLEVQNNANNIDALLGQAIAINSISVLTFQITADGDLVMDYTDAGNITDVAISLDGDLLVSYA